MRRAHGDNPGSPGLAEVEPAPRVKPWREIGPPAGARRRRAEASLRGLGDPRKLALGPKALERLRQLVEISIRV